MNRKLIISSLLMLAMLPASAQRLTVTKTTVDCGPVAYDKPVTAKFEMRNKGGRKLKITDVKTSCGCIGVDYPKGEIAAGETFTLMLTYDARQLGHFDKSARIISNGSKEPIYVNMKGVVMADLQDYSGSYPYTMGDLLVDKTNVEFDDVNKGDNPVQEIYIMNSGSTVFNPSVMHLPPYLSAAVTPGRIPPGRSGRIALTLNSSKLHDYGLTQTSVYLARNLGEKISSENEITVSAILLPAVSNTGGIAPKMELSADSIEINFENKDKKKAEIVITNNGRSELKIRSLQMMTSGLNVTLGKRGIKPGESTMLKITAMRDELKKQQVKPRVLMITNDPDRPKVLININYK